MSRAGDRTAARRVRRGATLVRVLSALLLATSAASAGLLAQRYWSELEPWLNPPLARVAVEGGLRHLTAEELEAVLEPRAGEGFFDLDLDQLRKQLESLPWVETAEVGRRWPDTLSVRLTEETVIARWGEDQLITQRGAVISPTFAGIDPSLPRLSGPPDSHFEVMRQYQRLNQILFPADLRLSGLSASPRRSWRLQLNGATEVVLGSEDLVDRLQRYVDFYRGLPERERRRHAAVDLRYGSQFSIRLREEDSGAGLARR